MPPASDRYVYGFRSLRVFHGFNANDREEVEIVFDKFLDEASGSSPTATLAEREASIDATESSVFRIWVFLLQIVHSVGCFCGVPMFLG